MNPFTRFLQQWTHDKDLHTFVEHCDALEALVIRVYKKGEASGADEAEYQALRRWLQANYPAWEPELRSFLKVVQTQDEGSFVDPLKAIISVEHAADFVGNWPAMQQLPTVREALNRLIMERSGENGRKRDNGVSS